MGLGTAMWSIDLYEGVLKSDCFSGLPHATLGRGKCSYVFYLGGGCQVRDIKGDYP